MWKILFFLIPIALSSAETVYCIHGFLRKPSSMNRMEKVFLKEGYEVEKWGYPSRAQTIQEHAEALVLDLQKTAENHPGEAIHFVTHSLGGIITRCAHNHPNFPDEAKKGRVVMIAPPNKGSKFGRFLGKHVGPVRKIVGQKAGKQILFSDHFNYVGEFPEGKEVLVISGTCGFNPTVGEPNDGKVGVSESCLNTPHKHITHFSGHSWIMSSKGVIKSAMVFIRDVVL